MDIKYKTDKVEIVIKDIRKGEVLSDEEIANIVKIIDLLVDEDSSISTGVSKIIKTPVEPNDFSDDRPMVRDRLPNRIDLSELELKKAVGTEPMIRCPECGQSSKAVVCINENENYLIRKVTKGDKETFETVLNVDDKDNIKYLFAPKTFIEEDYGEAELDYHNDILNTKQVKKFKNTDLNIDNDTEILCPRCHKLNVASKWIDAFNNPLEYFETDLLCEVCGGEAVHTIDENKNNIIKCERCGYAKKED